MTKVFTVECCNECPYIERMRVGEYGYEHDAGTWFCALSPIHFLILEQDRFIIHEWCGGEELETLLYRENLMKAIEERLDGCI